MEALKKEIYTDQSIHEVNRLKVLAKYDEENGKSLNDILKEMLKSSLVKESEKVF